MKEKEFLCLFPDFVERNEKEAEKNPENHNIKPSIYTQFVAKRNAARVSRYFINAKFTVNRTVAIIIFSVITILTLVLQITRINIISKNNLSEQFLNSMLSVQNQVVSRIENVIVESNFFSSFLAQLFSSDNPIVFLKKENARDVLTIINSCRKLSDFVLFWWDIGIKQDGQLFSIGATVDKEVPEYTCSYAYTISPTVNGTLFMTKFDGEEIPKELISKSTFNQTYNLYQRPWYREVDKKFIAMWVDMYMFYTNEFSEILISIVSPIINSNGFAGVVSNAFNADYLQRIIISMIPSQNSRLLLADSNNMVIAMNSKDRSIEVWNQKVLMKNVKSIDDEVWKTVAAHPKFSGNDKNKHFVFDCFIDSQSKKFILSEYKIKVTDNETWSLYSAICLSDYLKPLETTKFVSYAFSAIFIILTWSVTIIYMSISSRRLFFMQNQILNEDDFMKEGSTRMIFKKGLMKLISLNSNHNFLIEHINNILKYAKFSTTNLFYQPQRIIVDIEKTMKNLIRTRFNIQDTIHFSNIKVCIPPLGDDDEKPRVGDKSAYEINAFKNSYQILCCSKRTFRRTKEEQINFIVEVFVKSNSDKYFDNDKLSCVVKKYLDMLEPNVLFLAADSFDLMCYILSNNISIAFMTTDLVISIFISLLTWHVSMKNRLNEESPIDRYISQDQVDRYVVGDLILTDLEDVRSEEILYDTERWVYLVDLVALLLDAFPLSEQMFAISILRRIVGVREGTLLKNEELILLQVILTLCEYSFMFHDEETATKLTAILNSGKVDDEIVCFERSIRNQIILRALDVLKPIMDTTGLENMFSSQ